MSNDEQKILQKHLQYVICDVFNLPTAQDLLSIQGTKWIYKDNELPEANVVELRSQATKFLNSELWKILRNAILFDAQKRALNLSQTESDLIGAKMEIYLINEVEKLLKHMSG